VDEQIAIAGGGAIACGLAASAAHHGPVLLLARSSDSAERTRAQVESALARLESGPVEQLARASGRAERFLGLHVFNPVSKMKLVERSGARAAGVSTPTELPKKLICHERAF
jgi:3-hydroxyacyl-CoA dehydrogenase